MRTNARPAMLPCLSLTLAARTLPPTLTTIHNFTGNGANGSGCANCDGAVPSGGIVIGNAESFTERPNTAWHGCFSRWRTIRRRSGPRRRPPLHVAGEGPHFPR